jgi:hypothetical protein
MGTFTGQQIIDRAAKKLYDETKHDYSQAELLSYLQAKIIDLVAAKANAFSFRERFQLAEGTEQTIPEHCNQMVGSPRNAGEDGTKPGRGASWFDIEDMNRADPNWHTSPQAHTFDQYSYNPAIDRRTFWVYPPQEFPPHYAESTFFGTPQVEDDATQPIVLDDIYMTALVHGVVGEAMQRGTGRQDEAPSPDRAAFHLSIFTNLLKSIAENEAMAESTRRT